MGNAVSVARGRLTGIFEAGLSDRCCLPLYEEILIETRATPQQTDLILPDHPAGWKSSPRIRKFT
jgi:hypothetical protein